MVDQDGGRTVLPGLAPGGVPADSPAADGGGQRRNPVPWQLRNWRIRWRLVSLVLIPTLAAIVLGGFRLQTARDTAASSARIGQLAILGSDVTALADAVEDERDLTAGYIATAQGGQTAVADRLLGELASQYKVTGIHLAAVEKQAGQIGPSYPAVARTDLTFALSRLSALTDLRGLAHSQMPALPLTNDYSSVISTLLAFDGEIGVGSSSAQLAQTVSSLASLTQAEDETSQQRAILYSDLLQRQFGLGDLDALVSAQSGETSELAEYQTVAANLDAYVPGTGFVPALTEAQQFNDDVAGPSVDAAQTIEQDAIINGDNGQPPAGDPQSWFGEMSVTLNDMRGVETDELGSITAQVEALHDSSESSERLTGIAVLLLLLVVLGLTGVIARSMIRPLHRLRSDALDVAGSRLPGIVRRLSESDETANIVIEPVGVNSTDEIGEVARAFDQVHREAVRLAGEESLLRRTLNAMFVNLSRRSQSLIERQLNIIDSLEQSEQDPERLSSLFRLDHLATRMRRNSENLLVLAGHEAPRKWSQPVPLVDVLRAAISEIEQYERIAVNVQPGVVVAGRAASDVMHLVAELVENATTFSPATTQVIITGQQLTSGGVLLQIDDQGLGLRDEDLAYTNWRLDNPPLVDVAVSRRMGLFVVGRLAARHGIRVRLKRAVEGGLSALVWLPDLVAEADSPPLNTLRRRFDADGYGLPATAGPAVPATTTTTIPAAAALGRLSGAHARPMTQQAAFGRETAVAISPAVPPAQPIPAPVIPLEEPGLSAPKEPPAPATSSPRLPIYDAVESDWFHRGGRRVSQSQGIGTGPAGGQPMTTGAWVSPADDGFRAADAAVSPTVGDFTQAGLPKRVPSANLIPGSVGAVQPGQGGQPGRVARANFSPRGAQEAHPGQAASGGTARSPQEVRDRLASFQRGGREGRASYSGEQDTDEN
jgi:signal transduction histidine kinase